MVVATAFVGHCTATLHENTNIETIPVNVGSRKLPISSPAYPAGLHNLVCVGVRMRAWACVRACCACVLCVRVPACCACINHGATAVHYFIMLYFM